MLSVVPGTLRDHSDDRLKAALDVLVAPWTSWRIAARPCQPAECPSKVPGTHASLLIGLLSYALYPIAS